MHTDRYIYITILLIIDPTEKQPKFSSAGEMEKQTAEHQGNTILSSAKNK